MWLRKILLAAAVAVPLAWSPAPLDAQQGLDRAETATAQADEVAGWTHKKAPKAEKGLPPGIAARHEAGETLPPGIRRTRDVPEADVQPEPEVEPDPEPQPEPCSDTLVFDGVQWWVEDCNGNRTPL